MTLSDNICTKYSWFHETAGNRTEHVILENHFRRQNYPRNKLKESEEVPKQHIFQNNLFELAFSQNYGKLSPKKLDNQI